MESMHTKNRMDTGMASDLSLIMRDNCRHLSKRRTSAFYNSLNDIARVCHKFMNCVRIFGFNKENIPKKTHTKLKMI